MIQLNDVSLSFSSRDIFRNLTWHIKDGRKIGLFGPNGVGKTTLLNLIVGLCPPDSGRITIPPSFVVGYLPQEVQELNSELTVLEEALGAFNDVRELETESEALTEELELISNKDSLEYKNPLLRLDAIHNKLKTRDAHAIKHRTEKILMGLGFEVSDIKKRLSTFSGGWRMRVGLAKLLLQKPNLLLLDEPTNHLDVESIDWLERYLEKFQGSVILVSHDRYFLDRMVNTIAELSKGQITEYMGNYSSYVKERQSRLNIQKSAYSNQQRKIKETERFIERFRYKNTKAKQVQSRIKMLEKMERIEPPTFEDASILFQFPKPERSGKLVLDLSTFSKSYKNPDGSSLEVFSNAEPLSVLRGDKIALIGKNGAGKSTLARILLGSEPFRGMKKLGYNVSFTYFAQHQADALNPSNTILQELESESQGQSETYIRSLLGAFLFTEDEVYKPVKVLSGGEKSRVVLAKTLLSPKNFMILDEPTNHLDIRSRSVLVEALAKYQGTFIVISHDRNFLDQVANKIWYVENKTVIVYPGTYSEFHYHQTQREKANLSVDNKSEGLIHSDGRITEKSKQTEYGKRVEAQRRNRFYRELQEHGIENMENWKCLSSKQLEKALSDLEERIKSCEERKASLEKFLSDPSNFKDKLLSDQNSKEYSKLIDSLQTMYKKWESVSSHIQNTLGD